MPSLHRNRRALFALLRIAPFFVVVACGGTTSGDGPGSGDSGGDSATCKKGETKKADDGCNTCTCGAEGTFSCTLMACLDGGAFDTGGGTDSGKADVGVDAPANDPKCPKDWTAAQGTHDDLCPAHLTCNYAEGSCACPAYCGGPPPGPDWKPTWTCTPKPAPRTDGCPDAELTDGSACTGLAEHKLCDYGSCCFTQYECLSGRWKKSGPICPP